MYQSLMMKKKILTNIVIVAAFQTIIKHLGPLSVVRNVKQHTASSHKRVSFILIMNPNTTTG